MSSNTKIEPAPGLDFFYPLPPNPTGKAVAPEGKPLPKAFQPITVKKLTYENRLGVSPMCQYSAGDNYEMTPTTSSTMVPSSPGGPSPLSRPPRFRPREVCCPRTWVFGTTSRRKK